MKIIIPEFSLVILVGASSSLKFNFATEHFAAKDIFRIEPQPDIESLENEFQELYTKLNQRLEQVRTTIVDAPFLFSQHRKKMILLARQYGAAIITITFNVPAPLLRKEQTDMQMFTVGKELEYLSQAFKEIIQEDYNQTYHLDNPEAIKSASVEFSDDYDLSWGKRVFRQYQDFGRNPTQPIFAGDSFNIDLDIEFATELIFDKKASADVIRTVMYYGLTGIDDGSVIAYIQESARGWPPQEQSALRTYWFHVWHKLLHRAAAFDKWEWGMTAAEFIQNIENPEPFLVIWERHLLVNTRATLIHLINTLLKQHNYKPVFQAWLTRPIIYNILETAFYRYTGENKAFAARISEAEQKLIALKSD